MYNSRNGLRYSNSQDTMVVEQITGEVKMEQKQGQKACELMSCPAAQRAFAGEDGGDDIARRRDAQCIGAWGAEVAYSPALS